MTNEQKIEMLEQRVGALEAGFAEFVNDFLPGDAEQDFMDARQRWIDNCRERAAERRRTS